ncbi:MAG: hypothetical protein NVS2B3_09600 [Vulcanimicrobiaceae bacterium]
MKQSPGARSKPTTDVSIRKKGSPSGDEAVAPKTPAAAPATRRSVVAKVSHTLTVSLAERLEEFAFFQRISESAVIEHSLNAFFGQSTDDDVLGDALRESGAGRRRKA